MLASHRINVVSSDQDVVIDVEIINSSWVIIATERNYNYINVSRWLVKLVIIIITTTIIITMTVIIPVSPVHNYFHKKLQRKETSRIPGYLLSELLSRLDGDFGRFLGISFRSTDPSPSFLQRWPPVGWDVSMPQW